MGRPKATPEQERKALQTLKGPQAWCDWMNQLAEHADMFLPEMIDAAVLDYAKKTNFPVPFPGRKIPAQGPIKKSTPKEDRKG